MQATALSVDGRPHFTGRDVPEAAGRLSRVTRFRRFVVSVERRAVSVASRVLSVERRGNWG